jgi:monoterpene epsilon-lactone hydrolase
MTVRRGLSYLSCFVIGIILGGTLIAQWMKADPLPAPAGASHAIQAAISHAEPVNVAVRKLLRPLNEDQWRTATKQRAEAQAVSLDELSEQLGVTIKRDTIAGVAVHRVTPNATAADNDTLFIYLHGGAYVFGGGDASVREAALISALSGLEAVSIDYRMPPDHPHPAAITDVADVYRVLLQSYAAEKMGMGGTSAGGGLTLAAVHYFKQQGLPVPGALYLGTPWADLTKTGDTLYTMEGIDRILVTYDGALEAAALLYAGDTPLTDPLISPVYGDFTGFPPTYLVSGTRDMLLSDSARVHRKLRQAGVIAELNVYEGLSHAEYAIVSDSPEFQQNYGELSTFLNTHLQD